MLTYFAIGLEDLGSPFADDMTASQKVVWRRCSVLTITTAQCSQGVRVVVTQLVPDRVGVRRELDRLVIRELRS
jgi:hypothetical protein